MKQLIVFDLDGTLAESKSPLDAEMSTLLHNLLGIIKVAIKQHSLYYSRAHSLQIPGIPSCTVYSFNIRCLPTNTFTFVYYLENNTLVHSF